MQGNLFVCSPAAIESTRTAKKEPTQWKNVSGVDKNKYPSRHTQLKHNSGHLQCNPTNAHTHVGRVILSNTVTRVHRAHRCGKTIAVFGVYLKRRPNDIKWKSIINSFLRSLIEVKASYLSTLKQFNPLLPFILTLRRVWHAHSLQLTKMHVWTVKIIMDEPSMRSSVDTYVLVRAISRQMHI